MHFLYIALTLLQGLHYNKKYEVKTSAQTKVRSKYKVIKHEGNEHITETGR